MLFRFWNVFGVPEKVGRDFCENNIDFRSGLPSEFCYPKAKEIGYRVLTVDKDPKAPGFDYADKYAVIDIVDQDACLLYAQHHHVDGVITAATDYGVVCSIYSC